MLHKHILVARGGPLLKAAAFSFLLLTSGLSELVHASEEAQPYALPLTATHTLHSEHVGDTYHILVALPLGYHSAGPDAKFPVVFLTDADIGFAMAAQMARLLQLRKEIPALVIVGIGYGGMRPALVKRSRDLTPSDVEAHANCRDSEFPCGGAASFLRFIEKELKPFVAEHYQTDVSDNAFFGYSLGGLFGLYVLFEKPEVFDRYAIGSPSLWWGNGQVFDLEKDYARANSDLEAAVFLSIGSLDHQQMATRTSELAEQLQAREYSGLTITSVVFDGETHNSAAGATFSRAMRTLFNTQPSHPEGSD